MQTRMLLRMMAWPIGFGVGALLVVLGGWYAARKVATLPILGGAAPGLAELGEIGGVLLLLAAFVEATFKFRDYWYWLRGDPITPVCRNCGGIMGIKGGRRGPYSKCYACGARGERW